MKINDSKDNSLPLSNDDDNKDDSNYNNIIIINVIIVWQQQSTEQLHLYKKFDSNSNKTFLIVFTRNLKLIH